MGSVSTTVRSQRSPQHGTAYIWYCHIINSVSYLKYIPQEWASEAGCRVLTLLENSRNSSSTQTLNCFKKVSVFLIFHVLWIVSRLKRFLVGLKASLFKLSSLSRSVKHYHLHCNDAGYGLEGRKWSVSDGKSRGSEAQCVCVGNAGSLEVCPEILK